MNCLFENFEKIDIQAARQTAMEEGRAEGRAEGKEERLIEQICKKLGKGKSIADIASELEEDEPRIHTIVNVAEKYAPDYKVEEILTELLPL